MRLSLATAAPLATDRNERALIDDLEFTPAGDMTDLGGASLLVGVRDNDLKGRHSTDLTQLALVHGDPTGQREHCLRQPHESEPGGSQTAVLACRAFIRERIGQALAGLDAAGMPDLANRTSLPVFLALRHRVDALLPTYYVRVGQAIHTLEDSFTHTYRSADGMQITVVLDWVDQATRQLVESSDGPGHAKELDRCDDPDPMRQRRRELATEAATAVLRVTLDPAQTSQEKMAAVDAILDQYLTYAPGCTFDNNWCEAPERKYANQSVAGCSVGGIGIGGTSPNEQWGAALGGVALVLWGTRRRRRSTVSVAMLALTLVTAAGRPAVAEPARASSPASDGQGSVSEVEPPRDISPQGQSGMPQKKGPEDEAGMVIGAYLGISGAFDNPGFAATLGPRLSLNKHWTVGLDSEWNPWISSNGQEKVRAGVFNEFVTIIGRVPLKYEAFNLRITGSVGLSRLLIDLYGAPKGSTGIYAGFSPLGLEWKVSRVFYFVLNPLNLAVPTPHLTGVPLSYPQYRTTLGIEIYGG